MKIKLNGMGGAVDVQKEIVAVAAWLLGHVYISILLDAKERVLVQLLRIPRFLPFGFDQSQCKRKRKRQVCS